MSFGPGNAFGAFAPTVARPPRRVNSSGSFKDDNKATGPAPIDHPITPSFGSWAGDQQQQQQLNAQAVAQSSAEQQRSFSSILSPALPTPTPRQELENPLAKPFVYSREFLLSLYDDDKASRRPIELAVHEIATKEQGAEVTKPWALKEWRDGEKELFSTSIHPPASRVRSQHGQARNPVGDSNGHGGGAFGASPSLSHREINGGRASESNTLDLASLGALPRERDRALASPSLSARGPIGSPIVPSAEKERDLAAARRSRVGGAPLGGSTGILGGVLGGIVGSGRSPLSSPTMASATRKEAPGSAGAGGKDVWQGGRWRRQGSTQEDEEPKRPTAFGARRFPTQDDLSSPTSSRPGTPHGQNHSSSPAPSDGVRAAWDDDEDDSSVPASASGGQRSGIATPAHNEPAPQAQQEQADELDLTHHASSVLGSLALDSDPVDDPLSASNSNSTFSAPPGLPTPAAIPLVDHTWQYRDPSGQIQGPFAASMMHDWYRQTFFTPDLRVKRTQEREFETLENLIRRSGDAESPFLTAPLQAVATLPPPTTTAAQQGWPLGPSTPLDQFASPGVNGGAQSQRAFGSFYEPFGTATTPGGGAFDGQQQQQQFGFGGQQSRQASSQGVDPWGAPLPAASPAAWNDQSNAANLFNNVGGAYGQQQPQFAQHQQQQAQQPLDSPYQQHAQAQNPIDIFRQLAQQQQQPQQPQQPQQQQFYDPSQLASNDWRTTSQLQHAQQPQQPQQPQQQWSSLLPSRLDNLNLGQGSPAMSPIGPPATASAQQSPAISFAQAQQQQQPAPISPWGAVAPVESAPVAEVKQVVEEKKVVEAAQELPPPIAAPKEFTSIAKTTATDKHVKEAQAQAAGKEKEAAAAASKKEQEQVAAPSTPAKSSAPKAVPSSSTTEEILAPAPSASPAPKSSSAPWSAPIASSSPSTTPSGPSLREIQEAEAREADKRKAAARIQAAQANIQAAQRIAAQEAAEQLPASVQWASQPGSPVAGASAAKAPAPWSKPSKPVGKTLKEIQEEEERRKKAQAAASAQAAVASGPVQVQKGYASSVASAAKTVTGAPWTTVAVKPAAVATAAAAARPIIPGLNLPSSATTTRALPAKPAPSPVVRPAPAPVVVAAPAPAPPTVSVSSIIRSVAVNGRPASAGRPNGAQYDAENPPPPSEEFMKWCKDALKGLTVPMDEFIQMLLSFPLDASPDVLEIISDSVYANSSTLDGRRFANEYAARRKMDVAARYPQIAMSKTVNRVGGGKPTSMAEALKSQPVAKTPEWSVKVAGGKKKKAGK